MLHEMTIVKLHFIVHDSSNVFSRLLIGKAEHQGNNFDMLTRVRESTFSNIETKIFHYFALYSQSSALQHHECIINPKYHTYRNIFTFYDH